MEDEVGCDESLPIFQKFAFILNEGKTPSTTSSGGSKSGNTTTPRDDDLTECQLMRSESDTTTHNNQRLPFISKIGKLLVGKIRAHSAEVAELFGPDEVLSTKSSSASLGPVMYRIATESFVKESKCRFKVIEWRNVTKLASDWKPSLPDLLNSLGHQVIIVELKESLSYQTYNDFVYAVLRQLNYDWKIRLPRSFFYPDDVCQVDASDDYKLIVVTPAMPDGKFEFCDRVKNSLQYDILLMLKRSCESAMYNHCLLRDLRVGKFCDAVDGIESIRTVYRNLQERISSGEEVCLGASTEEFKLYLTTSAGGLIESAEAFLHDCKSYDDQSWERFGSASRLGGDLDDDGEVIVVLKGVDSGSSIESDDSCVSMDISEVEKVIGEEEDFSVIENILADLKTLAELEIKVEDMTLT